MKTLTLILIVVSNLVVGINNQIKNIYNIVNPTEFISKLGNQEAWFAYKVKAQAKTTSMCCWSGEGGDISQCNLDSKQHSYGSRAKSPITEHINIYVNVEKGEVKKMISVGDQCEVLANGHEINWLHDVTQANSIKWLKAMSFENKKHAAANALYTLALHEGDPASLALFDIAAMNNDVNSENAVFWLGEARQDGVSHLKKLYKNLPKGSVRRHINFALSQAESPQGVKLLKQIAKKDEDSDQRADALFWLAQKNVKGIVPMLLDVIKKDPTKAIKEKAIFNLSQVKSDAARNALLVIAKNDKDAGLQDKALFWLAQVDPTKAKAIVLKILKNTNTENKINNAVFTLAQISQDNNDEALFELLTNNYSAQVKKQALFWLGQSDNDETIDKLQKLL